LALRDIDQILTAAASFLIIKTKYLSRGNHTTWYVNFFCLWLSVSTVKLSAS